MTRAVLVSPCYLISSHHKTCVFCNTKSRTKQNINNSPITQLCHLHSALLRHNFAVGHAMTEARLEARVRSQDSACGICGRKSGRGSGFSPGILVFPCQYDSTYSPCSFTSGFGDVEVACWPLFRTRPKPSDF